MNSLLDGADHCMCQHNLKITHVRHQMALEFIFTAKSSFHHFFTCLLKFVLQYFHLFRLCLSLVGQAGFWECQISSISLGKLACFESVSKISLLLDYTTLQPVLEVVDQIFTTALCRPPLSFFPLPSSQSLLPASGLSPGEVDRQVSIRPLAERNLRSLVQVSQLPYHLLLPLPSPLHSLILSCTAQYQHKFQSLALLVYQFETPLNFHGHYSRI